VTAKHFYEGCHGKCKIFVLHLNVISENHTKFQPATFQCSGRELFIQICKAVTFTYLKLVQTVFIL